MPGALAMGPVTGHHVLSTSMTNSALPTERNTQPLGGLTFSLFGIPVRIATSFWIIAILFGTGTGGNTSAARAVAEALIWTAIVFVSILMHELGHATAARAFGAAPTITLHALGGLTHFEAGKFSRLQHWLVSFAGPAVGLLLGTTVYFVTRAYPVTTTDARDLVRSILFVNIGWSIVNLLPVLPFDGGQMLSAFLGPRRELWTAIISAVVGTAIALLGYVKFNNLWIAFLFGSSAFSAMRQVRALWSNKVDRDAGLEDELAGARSAISRGDAPSVLLHAHAITSRARTKHLKNAGVLVQAWAEATLGRTSQARQLLESLERDVPADPYLIAALEDALGAPERARMWLEAERRQSVPRIESVKLLIDLHARQGDLEKAVDVATESLDVLSREDAEAVHAAGVSGGAKSQSARLRSALDERYGTRESPEGTAHAAVDPPTN